MRGLVESRFRPGRQNQQVRGTGIRDRKSTRLNSSHLVISYAVFCLKKKKIEHILPVRLTNSPPPPTHPLHSPISSPLHLPHVHSCPARLLAHFHPIPQATTC